MRRKLRTRRGRQRYALRMQTVEPVFGQIKQGRGFRQFLLRGLEKVQGEWSLICTGHNLLKLFRFGANQPRKTRINSIVRCIRNIAEVASVPRQPYLPVRRQSVLPVHLLGMAPLLGCISPVAGDVKLQDDGVVHHPVDCRGGGHGVGKDAFPLREDQV